MDTVGVRAHRREALASACLHTAWPHRVHDNPSTNRLPDAAVEFVPAADVFVPGSRTSTPEPNGRAHNRMERFWARAARPQGPAVLYRRFVDVVIPAAGCLNLNGEGPKTREMDGDPRVMPTLLIGERERRLYPLDAEKIG